MNPLKALQKLHKAVKAYQDEPCSTTYEALTKARIEAERALEDAAELERKAKELIKQVFIQRQDSE